jgi:hypothetical protein
VHNPRRNKDGVACPKDLLFLVEPLFELAADGEDDLFLVGMINESLAPCRGK